MINLLDNTTNQSSKFRIKNWLVEITNESPGTYNVSNQIEFKTSMISSKICGYSGGYIHVNKTTTVPNTGTVATSNNRIKIVKFKNFAPLTNCTSEINNTQVGDVHDIDVVNPIYDLIEYSDTYSQASERLWQY